VKTEDCVEFDCAFIAGVGYIYIFGKKSKLYNFPEDHVQP
jgi:hypothetical protein